MDQVAMQTEMARATRESRTTWAKAFFFLAFLSAIVGFALYHNSEPNSLRDAAHNAVVAMARISCPTDPSCDGGSYIRAQPIYLYVGGAGAALFLLIGMLLLATRPSAPERAWTDARA